MVIMAIQLGQQLIKGMALLDHLISLGHLTSQMQRSSIIIPTIFTGAPVTF